MEDFGEGDQGSDLRDLMASEVMDLLLLEVHGALVIAQVLEMDQASTDLHLDHHLSQGQVQDLEALQGCMDLFQGLHLLA